MFSEPFSSEAAFTPHRFRRRSYSKPSLNIVSLMVYAAIPVTQVVEFVVLNVIVGAAALNAIL